METWNRSTHFATPLGTVLEMDRVERPRPFGWRKGIQITIGWEKGSAEAVEMRERLDEYVEIVLGPDAPLLVAAGELWSPLRDGDLERPGIPGYAGRIFAEFPGRDYHPIIDFRPGGTGNCLAQGDPEVDPIFGPGAGLRVSAGYWIQQGCPITALRGCVAVMRGAPGWETWLTTLMARQARG